MTRAGQPHLVAHADWSTNAEGRWLARAILADGRYRALCAEPVGPLESFWKRIEAEVGTALLGFDFPIGLPRAYAKRSGIDEFVALLPRLGEQGWARFYEVARTADEIAARQPFYPHSARRKGEVERRHLLAGLGLQETTQLLRRCDRKTAARNAACMLFWTIGPNQVGKAAIVGWRDLLAPALRRGTDLAIWPFHGALNDLIARHRIVVAETYPGEVYGHLGLELRSWGGKQEQSARRANAARLLDWAAAASIDLDASLRAEIDDGFGTTPSGDHRFDAVVGLFGMLNVVLGRRPSGEPAGDEDVRRIEGWILGQTAG